MGPQFELCDGGVGSLLLADPADPSGARVKVRTHLANVRDPQDGLLAEVRLGLPLERRTPWSDRASRDWAIRVLERGPCAGMSEDEQRSALEYVRATGFYD